MREINANALDEDDIEKIIEYEENNIRNCNNEIY